MKFVSEQTPFIKNRENERGAALVMVLLISMLLLVAGSALLYAASMNTANVTDSVAEQQAYYAAESGIQSALNVLRNDNDDDNNINPTPLIDTTKSEDDSANEIDYRKAANPSLSINPNTDSETYPRLSRWLNYSSPGAPTRVPVGTGTGQAFSLRISDPDNTCQKITYSIVGYKINGVAAELHYPNSGSTNKFIISYNKPSPAETTHFNVCTGAAAANFGNFTITVPSTSAGATIPNNSVPQKAGFTFEIIYKMTHPYEATRQIRGRIVPIHPATGVIGAGNGTITSTSVNDVKIKFESQVFELMGSQLTISNLTNITTSNSVTNYIMTPKAPNVDGGVTPITGTVTSAEPKRLLLVSTGFGPRGARKQLEAIVQKDLLNGLYAPATLTLIGSATGAVYDPGNSSASTMSGDDVVSNYNLPPVGVSDPALIPEVLEEHDDNKPSLSGGMPADVSTEMPSWLQSTTALHTTLADFERTAITSSPGRCFRTTPVTISYPATPGCINTTVYDVGNYGVGNNATGSGITFVHGDAAYSPNIMGGGILIVTGKLEFKGDFDFKGLIIVTGAEGMVRSGGGGSSGTAGNLQGNIVVAPYNRANLGGGFLPPKYHTSGGGSSTVRYNSSSVNNGLLAVSNFILGIAEK